MNASAVLSAAALLLAPAIAVAQIPLAPRTADRPTLDVLRSIFPGLSEDGRSLPGDRTLVDLAGERRGDVLLVVVASLPGPRASVYALDARTLAVIATGPDEPMRPHWREIQIDAHSHPLANAEALVLVKLGNMSGTHVESERDAAIVAYRLERAKLVRLVEWGSDTSFRVLRTRTNRLFDLELTTGDRVKVLRWDGQAYVEGVFRPPPFVVGAFASSSRGDDGAPERSVDGVLETAWTAEEPPGTKEWIAYAFSDPIVLSALKIVGGCGATAKEWRENPRLRKVRITLGDGRTQDATLEDTDAPQAIALEGGAPIDRLKLEVVEVRPGRAGHPACLSEVRFDTVPVAGKESPAAFRSLLRLGRGDPLDKVQAIFGEPGQGPPDLICFRSCGVRVAVDDAKRLRSVSIGPRSLDDTLAFLRGRDEKLAYLGAPRARVLAAFGLDPGALVLRGIYSYRFDGGTVTFECPTARKCEAMSVVWE